MLAGIMMLFLISASVCLTLAFKPLYYFDIDYLDIAETSGYPESEIRENYDALIDYNLSPAREKLVFPTLTMSQEGEIHFREVKAIFQFFLKAMLWSMVAVFAGFLIKRRRREYGFLKWAGLLTPAVILAVGLFLAADWDRAFVLFHELVFRNDYWLFDPVTDPVITILPDTFFLHCAIMILGLIAAGSAVCVAAWKYYDKKRSNGNEKTL